MSQVLQLLAHFVLLLLKILQLLVLQLSRLGHFPHHQAHGDGELEGGVGRGGRDGGICVVAVKKVFDVVAVAAAVVIIGCYVVVVDVHILFYVAVVDVHIILVFVVVVDVDAPGEEKTGVEKAVKGDVDVGV